MNNFRVFAALLAVALFSEGVTQERAPLTEDAITEEMLAQGAILLADGTCARCHARDGSGTELGPDLTDDEWLHGDGSPQSIRATVATGVPRGEIKNRARRQPMEPMGQMMLDDDQLDALAAYVWSLSRSGSTDRASETGSR